MKKNEKHKGPTCCDFACIPMAHARSLRNSASNFKVHKNKNEEALGCIAALWEALAFTAAALVVTDVFLCLGEM